MAALCPLPDPALPDARLTNSTKTQQTEAKNMHHCGLYVYRHVLLADYVPIHSSISPTAQIMPSLG